MSKLHEKEKKPIYANRIATLLYSTLLSKEFLLFSTMLISIKTVAPIWTTIAVCLMIPFAIHTFKDMRIGLAFLSGQSICFLIVHATLHFLSVIFGDVSSIAFSTSGDMRMTAEY